MNFFRRLLDVGTGRRFRYEIQWRDNHIKALEERYDRSFETYEKNLELANKKYEDNIKDYRNACIKSGQILLQNPDLDKTDLAYSGLKTIWKHTDMIRYEFPIMAITKDKYTLNTSSLESSFVILNALDDLGFRCSIFEKLLKASYELKDGWTISYRSAYRNYKIKE